MSSGATSDGKDIWVDRVGQFGIVSNQGALITRNGTGDNIQTATAKQTVPGDYSFQLTMPVILVGTGVCYRFVDSLNYWKVVARPTYWQIVSKIAGVEQVAGTVYTQPHNGVIINVVTQGNYHWVYFERTLGAGATISNPNLLSGDEVGCVDAGSNLTARWDDLLISPPVPGPLPGRVPGAPTNLAASAGVLQVSLSWTAPADPGTAPITGYQVTSVTGGVSSTTTSTGTSVVISGLTGGATYSFTVKAQNQVGLSAASSAVTAIPGISGGGGTRDPFLQPFLSDDAFNYPMGSGATFDPTAYIGESNINALNYSIAIWQAQASDPMVTWTADDGTGSVTVNTPAGAHGTNNLQGNTSGGDESGMAIVNPTRTASMEDVITNLATHHGYTKAIQPDLRGYSTPYGYLRATGLSMMGGVIRKWEIDGLGAYAAQNYRGAIKHAIAIGLGGELLQNPPTMSPGIVYPAHLWDGGPFNGVDNHGPIPYGARLAIPPGVSFPGNVSPLDDALFWALQDYGAIASDRNGGGSGIYAEWAASSSANYHSPTPSTQYLRLVTNGATSQSRPANLTGGGTLRQPFLSDNFV